MNKLHRFLILLLLLFVTACGASIDISIDLPERATDAPITETATSTATRTLVAPTATNTQPAPTATPSSTIVSATTLDRLNVRSGPATSFAIIRTLNIGQTVQVIGRTANSSWLQISDGWISSQFVMLTGNIQSIPVISIDPTPTQERPKARISYNINGVGVANEAYFIETVTQPCTTFTLVMDNLSLAVRIKQICPDMVVVSRSWSVLEGDEWFYRSPQNFIDQWRREGHPEIVRHSTNEPSFGIGTLAQFVAKEIELMQLAHAAGFKVAMGNFSVGYYRLEAIQSGGFDSYLRAINQYGHFLAVHEYACCLLPFGVGRWGATALLDRINVQPASWPTAAQLPTRYVNGQCPGYWHMRRADCFLLRADTLGIPRPRILVTEFGWDNLPDVKPYIEPLRAPYCVLDGRYFCDLRGVNTYPELWEYYWPEWSFAQAACKQLIWADSIYPADYWGFALFTWSRNLEHWGQTDFSGIENPAHYQLHDCLEVYHRR